MEIAAYRLFYDNIHDFKKTAVYVESEIHRYGIRSDSDEVVPGMNGRRHFEMWASMKTVSHFNLGIALELMLKLILFLNKIKIPNKHRLVVLHDSIPLKCQKQLETTYQDSMIVLPQGYQLVALIIGATPPDPPCQPARDISSLRDFLEYLDKDAILWQKRYSWELFDNGRWCHYLSDISVFVEFIERVMRNIQR